MKTSLRRTVTSLRSSLPPNSPLPSVSIADLSASFQIAVVDVLVEKTMRAARFHGVRQVALSGGVACNGFLRAALEHRCKLEGMRLAVAERSLCTDNAAMIALLAERKMKTGFTPPAAWDIEPDWILS